MARPWIVAVTGGIGSGKSTVCRAFEKHGIQTVDTDDVAKSMTVAGGPAITHLRRVFGPELFSADGAMDRVAMRQLVFSNPDAKAQLEAILHPMIRDATLTALAQAQSPYVLLGIPLLAAAGKASYGYQRAIVVDCLPSEQITRVMARSQLDSTQVQAIMRTQLSRQTRALLADDLILNFDGQPDLSEQVARLDLLYRQLLTI